MASFNDFRAMQRNGSAFANSNIYKSFFGYGANNSPQPMFQNPELSKAMLDGTDAFGANSYSAPNPYASMTPAMPEALGGPNGYMLSKAQLDGTDSFGANSILGAQSPTAGGGILDGVSSFLKGAVGTKDAPGWGGLALNTAAGLGNMYLGMKSYGLARDTLDNNKEQFERNIRAQQKMTNSRLEDRQAARVASGRGYESVSDYMKKYAV